VQGEFVDQEKRLIDAAKAIRNRAHAPYSEFLVGSALVDENGNVFTGCNVENAAYPEGVCAETNAIGAMVAGGGKRIVAIAAVGGSDDITPCTPCGGCRQRILEFSDEHTRVVLIGDKGDIESHLIGELLPAAFSL